MSKTGCVEKLKKKNAGGMQCGLCEIAFDREMSNEFLYNDFSLSVKNRA